MISVTQVNEPFGFSLIFINGLDLTLCNHFSAEIEDIVGRLE